MAVQKLLPEKLGQKMPENMTTSFLRFSKLDSFCLLEIGSASNLTKKAQKQKRERKKIVKSFCVQEKFFDAADYLLEWSHFHLS